MLKSDLARIKKVDDLHIWILSRMHRDNWSPGMILKAIEKFSEIEDAWEIASEIITAELKGKTSYTIEPELLEEKYYMFKYDDNILLKVKACTKEDAWSKAIEADLESFRFTCGLNPDKLTLIEKE